MRRLMLICAGLLGGCGSNVDEGNREAPPVIEAAITFDGAAATGSAQIAHGDRLTWALGCRGCHGDKLTGELWDDDPKTYGVTWASNLTRSMPAMTDTQLRGVIFEGKHPRRPQLWSMPSELFQYLAEPDRAALVAYLRTVKPEGKPSPDPQLGPKAKAEIAAGAIKPADVVVAESRKSQPIDLGPRHALGRMITMVSCAECHGYSLEGKPDDDGPTPDLAIVAAYSRDEFNALTTRGVANDNRKIHWLMVSVGKDRLSRLTQHERDAVYDYLIARADRPQ